MGPSHLADGYDSIITAPAMGENTRTGVMGGGYHIMEGARGLRRQRAALGGSASAEGISVLAEHPRARSRTRPDPGGFRYRDLECAARDASNRPAHPRPDTRPTQEMAPIVQLTAATCQGDTEAFAQLLAAVRPSIRYWSRRSGLADVSDLEQDMIWALWQALQKAPPRGLGCPGEHRSGPNVP